MSQLDFAQLAALVAVIDEGSFDGAASILGISQPAVSNRIKLLEASAGQILLKRSRPTTVTEAGQRYLKLGRQVAALAADTLANADGQGTVVLPIAVNTDSIARWVLGALAPLSPGILFDIRCEDQDYSAELLRNGSVMAAITTTQQPVQGCTSTRLGVMKYRVVAAPAFASRWFPAGLTVDTLAQAPVVVFDRNDDLQHAYLRNWARRDLAPPCHYIPSPTAYSDAIRYGMGWGLLPDDEASEGEARKTLVDLDPGYRMQVTLFWQQWSLHTAALDAVAATIRVAASAHLV